MDGRSLSFLQELRCIRRDHGLLEFGDVVSYENARDRDWDVVYRGSLGRSLGVNVVHISCPFQHHSTAMSAIMSSCGEIN